MRTITKRSPWGFRPQVTHLESREQPGSAWSATGLAMLDGGWPWLETAIETPGLPVAPARFALSPTEQPSSAGTADSVVGIPLFPEPWNQPASSQALVQPLFGGTTEGPGLLSLNPEQPNPGQMWFPLWYNGDFDGRDWLPNEFNASIADSRVYDDFLATAPPRVICLCRVYSNDFMDFQTDRANWEIRYGVGEHDPGVLVARGFDVPAVQTPTGRTFRGLNEFTISVELAEPIYICIDDINQGHFWLNVTPVGKGAGQSFMSTTSGANAIGNPPGNNGLSYIDSTSLGFNFEATENVLGTGTWDFSEGVDIMHMH